MDPCSKKELFSFPVLQWLFLREDLINLELFRESQEKPSRIFSGKNEMECKIDDVKGGERGAVVVFGSW